MRVLCLDIEGGYGGSSRSLYYTIKNMPSGQVACEVWHRKDGPIKEAYKGINVPTRSEPRLRSLSALFKQVNGAYDFLHGAFRLLGSERGIVGEIAEAVRDRFDLIHFNHEGLWQLARLLRSKTSVPFSMHVRRVTPLNTLGRIQVASINKSIDRLIYISNREKEHFEKLGCAVQGSVVHNIVEPIEPNVTPHPDIPDDSRLKVASLANYSWARGVDRVIDIAEALKSRSREDILFVFAGNLDLPASMPGQLGAIGRQGGGLKELAVERSVSEMCLFLGHVNEPERVTVGCQALVKTSRRDFPWGRDILETMRAGKPVYTTGTDTTFVETGETGYLSPVFNAEEAADCLVDWADNPDSREALGIAARERVTSLCDGKARAKDVLEVWKSVKRT